MKYLFSFLLFLAVIPCCGQNIDSLKEVASGNSPARQRLNAVEQLSRYYDSAETKSTINPDSLAAAYAEFAGIYAREKNYDKAVALYEKVIIYAPKSGSRQLLMTAMNQLGQLYEAKRNYREALNYYRQSFAIKDSLDFVKKTRENTSEAYSHSFMSDVMGSIGQKSKTAEELLQTIETKRAVNDTLALTINYFNLGILYKSKQMYPQALDALKNCLDFATKIHYTDMQSSAANELSDLYEQTGDHRLSLVYLKKYMAANALANTAGSKTIDELQTKYEIIQKEDKLLQQQFEITKRNYWMKAISIIIILMLVIGFIYYKQTRLKQRNIAMKAIIETEESERRRIAQDLHDSVSQTISAAKINLTVIGGELPLNDEQRKKFERAISMVDDGFKEVRTISHNMMPWALNQTGLAAVIRQFITNIDNGIIQANFFSKGFDEPFDDTIEIILYRVLQESVNNVMKHAQASRLDISLIRDKDNISLTIEDNGKGFDTNLTENYKGMGLNNMQSRINFLSGKVEIDSQVGKGTLVSVYIPLGGKKL